MNKKLPSAHQHGDAVNLRFGDAGFISNGKITKVSFDPTKTFYDVEINVKSGLKTRLRMIDGSFVEKITYYYTVESNFRFECSNMEIDKEYIIYDKDVNFIWENNKLFSDQPGSTDPDNYPKVKYVGYNRATGVSNFESAFKLKLGEIYQVPLTVRLPNGVDSQLIYNIVFKSISDEKTHIDDIIQGFQTKIKYPTINNNRESLVKGDDYNLLKYSDAYISGSEYDIPKFSIKDIDTIFDLERNNHGTNPIDSINRMYRKFLLLKEKGV